jgi:glycosyltransferase involved in cell wall biosynthesis
MTNSCLVSIIINNYNYGRFLQEAINSTLYQTYLSTEVIVVDDGSTDNSRNIITSYGSKIIPVLKENEGQASAFNAGFLASHGDIIIFLDSDDVLLPTAAEKAVEFFENSDLVKVHWALWEIDSKGNRTGRIKPTTILPDGDIREDVLLMGPEACGTPPTTCHAWSRRFLEEVLPMPVEEYKICADNYLFVLAMASGPMKRILEPQGLYRIHDQNKYYGLDFDEKMKRDLLNYDISCNALQKYYQNINIDIDVTAWKSKSWKHQLNNAVEQIKSVIPEKNSFILVDENQLGMSGTISNRYSLPFIEKNGQYWGPPSNDNAAINELTRLRELGAGFIVFAWTAFWWLDYYKGFHNYLCSKYQCVLENERLVVFDLRKEID